MPFLLDDEEKRRAKGLAGYARSSITDMPSIRCRRLIKELRQVDGKGAAFSRLTGDNDLSMMAIDDSLHNRHAQARAFVAPLGRIEGVEQATLSNAVHSGPGIGYFQANIGARGKDAMGMRNGTGLVDISRGNKDGSSC